LPVAWHSTTMGKGGSHTLTHENHAELVVINVVFVSDKCAIQNDLASFFFGSFQ